MSDDSGLPSSSSKARARAQPLPQFAPGSRVAGYEVLGRLGAGGYGTVYRVRCEGHVSALKVLPLETSDGWEEREVDVMRRLRHPNVACLRGYFDWPTATPRFRILLMDYVEGDPLDVHARRHGLTALDVVGLMLPLADALGTIHEAGVVHRDVKESNILVRGSDQQPVLVDFGAGHYEGAPTLTSAFPPGTWEYRSPEAWSLLRPPKEGEAPYRLGPPDDLWATGVVLYWMLTDRRPFVGRDMLDVGTSVLHRPLVPPRERNPRVPEALESLCLRLLERERQARLTSAWELRAELEALRQGADASWRVPLFEGQARRVPPSSRRERPPPREEEQPSLLQPVPSPPPEEPAAVPEEAEVVVRARPGRPGRVPRVPVLGALLLLAGTVGMWLLTGGMEQRSSAVELPIPPATSPRPNPIHWDTFFRQ
jgi:eukaryotic-like serine/threonine-protein kinase